MRVSTVRQGRSGLGIEAQRKAVEDYLNGRQLAARKGICRGWERQKGRTPATGNSIPGSLLVDFKRSFEKSINL
jgi:hypothetical protein